MPDSDIAFAPATEIRRLIASKELSPVEITELYLRRIEELDPRLNSYLTVPAEQAMDAARAAEAAFTGGSTLGPLHGVPVSIKDLELTDGLRTTSGSLIYQDRVPDEDSGSGGAGQEGRRHSPWQDQHSGVWPPGTH